MRFTRTLVTSTALTGVLLVGGMSPAGAAEESAITVDGTSAIASTDHGYYGSDGDKQSAGKDEDKKDKGHHHDHKKHDHKKHDHDHKKHKHEHEHKHEHKHEHEHKHKHKHEHKHDHKKHDHDHKKHDHKKHKHDHKKHDHKKHDHKKHDTVHPRDGVDTGFGGGAGLSTLAGASLLGLGLATGVFAFGRRRTTTL